MVQLKEIMECLESYAPLDFQESYDNAGLICGNPQAPITGALLCLDSTEAVIDEAIATGCNLVIAHHPIVFSGLKKITGKNYIERVLIKAIKHDIAIYAAHTNLDAVSNGVNAVIARKLGLQNTKILAPAQHLLKKLVVFCPESHAEELKSALFDVGAGRIGNYSECSFAVSGTGNFRAGEGANPFVGEPGQLHSESETRIEMIFPGHLERKLIAGLHKYHPYEEPAYDVYALSNTFPEVGSGMLASLAEPMDEIAFLELVKLRLNAVSIRYTALRGKPVKTVAICGGSGSFLLEAAKAAGADVFVTADFKYHQFFDAEDQLVIADIGHYESEQFTPELFYDILKKKFSTFALHLSKINTNPIKYL